MERLLDQLVQLSRAGESIGRRQAVELGPVAREALSRVEDRRQGEGNGRVAVTIREGLPTVLGDRDALVQVFQHLIDNAVRFSADAGEPVVTVEAGGRTRQEATVIVRDNGRGVDPVHHQRVFGLFERLDPAVDGAGVGLTLVRRIVALHGGQVGLESPGAGCGTEVWVRLPVPREDKEPAGLVGAREGASRPSE
jgi:signal transduction histidine kinase